METKLEKSMGGYEIWTVAKNAGDRRMVGRVEKNGNRWYGTNSEGKRTFAKGYATRQAAVDSVLSFQPCGDLYEVDDHIFFCTRDHGHDVDDRFGHECVPNASINLATWKGAVPKGTQRGFAYAGFATFGRDAAHALAESDVRFGTMDLWVAIGPDGKALGVSGDLDTMLSWSGTAVCLILIKKTAGSHFGTPKPDEMKVALQLADRIRKADAVLKDRLQTKMQELQALRVVGPNDVTIHPDVDLRIEQAIESLEEAIKRLAWRQ